MEILAKKLEEEYESNSDVSCEHDHKIHVEIEAKGNLKLDMQIEQQERQEHKDNIPPSPVHDTNIVNTSEGEAINEDFSVGNFNPIDPDSGTNALHNGTAQEGEGNIGGILKNVSPSRTSPSSLVDSAVNTSRPGSRQWNRPSMVDSSVNTSRPSSRQNARMSPPTHPAFPTTDSGTMTSRPNSKQSSRGHSRPSSRQSSSLRPGSRQSTRSE